MGWLAKFLQIDRRWIFLAIAVAVVIPFIWPMGLPVVVTKPVQDLYDAVDAIPPNSQPLFISVDYAPSTVPELDPMTYAILRHAFSKDIRVVVLTLDPAGYGLAERALETVAREYGKERNRDYAYLGFQPGIATVVLGMGVDIAGIFPEDAYGTPLSEIPVMNGIKNYDQVPLLVTIASSGVIEAWVIYAHQPYDANIGAGVTAVMATDYYPFLDTGQLVGLLGGMRGAAEYETLVEHPDAGVRGMDSQSVIHILIIALIVLGNVAYFGTRKRRQQEAAQDAKQDAAA
jgi:hypothetical protein